MEIIYLTDFMEYATIRRVRFKVPEKAEYSFSYKRAGEYMVWRILPTTFSAPSQLSSEGSLNGRGNGGCPALNIFCVLSLNHDPCFWFCAGISQDHAAGFTEGGGSFF